jgi:hypothetical protein
MRVIRGGSWRDRPSNGRSASRYGVAPGGRFSVIGFRVACVRRGLDYELKKHPPKAVSFQGRWYAYYSEKSPSWREAQRRCQEMGGYLACPRTLAEQQFVQRLVQGQHAWLGGYCDERSRWFWVTGERVGTFYWAPGQPNNGPNAFMQLLPGATGDRTWHDIGEGEQRNYAAGIVCQWDF